MQRIAAEAGFSETVFAIPVQGEPAGVWRVRYFSPETEVPFCDHATIATTAVLVQRFGAGEYQFQLNQATLQVSAEPDVQGNWQAAYPQPAGLIRIGYRHHEPDMRIPPALNHGGADHLVLALKERSSLAAMRYSQPAGRELMRRNGWVTILLVCGEDAQKFYTRHPFAYGDVYEDPATGAASAAFAGYLRDLQWPHNGAIEIVQGEDMGMRSRIFAGISDLTGSPIAISGQVRQLM
ncbi:MULTISPECIES: PhzF family phenazine biosynthesis protein [Tatumella]|uniref:PhzF family phenazine biosynthesis protein n=1 Tax=Tatumella punctata TaxID=399969 RepID=A0ABW1VPY9_9GAMM|nr:PhzF family phenazine biosynthesis isomerase [Tatumella sp. JGM130]MBS0894467.1 PhzF family phenazine biosynthesis isomerase [Tatumella sp. JGM130]